MSVDGLKCVWRGTCEISLISHRGTSSIDEETEVNGGVASLESGWRAATECRWIGQLKASWCKAAIALWVVRQPFIISSHMINTNRRTYSVFLSPRGHPRLIHTPYVCRYYQIEAYAVILKIANNNKPHNFLRTSPATTVSIEYAALLVPYPFFPCTTISQRCRLFHWSP